MNEDRFRYFIEICECGNITKAAANLYVSQPALSKYLSRLEDEIGLKLIDRECVPIKLSVAGQRYYEYAKDMFERYQRMRGEMNQLNQSIVKTLNLGIATNLSKFYLRDVLKLAADISSPFDFKVIEETSGYMQKYVENGTVDVAFLNTDNIHHSRIDYTVVKEDGIFMVCRKSNPALKNRKPFMLNGVEQYVFSKDEVGELPFYSLSKRYKMAEIVDKYLAKKGIEIKNSMDVPELETLLYLVRDTNRFAFSPQFFVEESGMAEDIALCCIDGEALKWYMVLARLKDNHLSKPILEWLDKVKEFYADGKW